MKHCRLSIAPRDSLQLQVQIPPDPHPGYPEWEYKYMQLTLHWRMPSRDLGFLLSTPSGEELDLGSAGGSFVLSDGTTQVRASRDDSSRGTAMFDIWVYGYRGGQYHPIDNGSWSLVISDPADTDPDQPAVELSGYLSDDISGWGVGVHFPEYTSEEHLVCFPATADSAITVAAYTGHGEMPYDPPGSEAAGKLRRYSGRGTRIDGVSIVDIAAPDNPLAPTSRVDYGGGIEIGHGAYRVFGGTSGAGPHVAGAAALVKQLYPELDGYQVRDRLRQAALVDADVAPDPVHAVEDLWGGGKLRVFEALFGHGPAPNTPPSIAIGPVEAHMGRPIRISPEVSDSEDGPAVLMLLWDDDYDGIWDSGPTPADQPREMIFDALGTQTLKVQVVDTGGLTAAALVRVSVGEPPADGGCSCASTRSDGWLALVAALLAGLIWMRRSN